MDVDELAAAGLYDPDASNASERLALLEYLRDRGATLEAMVAALREGTLVALASDLRRRGPGPSMNARELAGATGMTTEQVLAVSRAAGLPTLDEDAPAFDESTVEAYRIVQDGNAMFGDDAILQFTRVIGASLASIADAAMALFGINVIPRLDARGASELERAQTTELASAMLVEQVPVALTTLFRFHVDAAVRRSTASGGVDGAHLAHLTVGFLDLAESTPMVRALAPDALAAAIGEFERDAVELAAELGGRVVKTIGDEVMFVMPSAAAACVAALGVRDAVDRHPVLTALRGGLAAGGIVRGYGDFYGPEVNRAARIVKLAEPGSILVTDGVREQAVTDESLRFAPAGEHALAGFDAPTRLFAVSRS